MKLEKEVKEIEQGRCHMFLHLLVARYIRILLLNLVLRRCLCKPMDLFGQPVSLRYAPSRPSEVSNVDWIAPVD